MKKKTYFSMIFKKAFPEAGIQSRLLRVAKLKNEDNIKNLTKEYHEFLKAKAFEEHFEIIYSKIPLQSSKELHLKKLAIVFDIGVRLLKSDYEDFKNFKETAKRKAEADKFPLLLEKTFKLKYTPYISRVYKENHNFITFNTDKESTRLCNIFVPSSLVITEINGKSKTYIKILVHHKRQIIEIVESIRDFNKSDRLANTFGDYGFFIDSATASKISGYLSDYMKNNQDKVIEEMGRLQTGWKNKKFYIPQREQNVVWLEPNLKRAYTSIGAEENQITLLQELSKGKVFINVLGAFASPLFGLVQATNFFIHNGGLTEGGKSLAVKCALSFFGDHHKMGNNFNATLNGLETYWEQNHSLPMWIDEMEVAKRPEDITDAVYGFFDGKGKVRAYSSDGEVKQRETKIFKGICFTTGEKSFSEVQNMVKDGNKKRGVTRRVLDLNIRELWDSVNMEKIKLLIDENHGILGIKYIEFLENNFDNIKDDYKNQCSFFNGLADGDKKKQFGILKLALEVIYKMGLIPVREYEVQIANLKYFAKQEQENMKSIKDTYTEFTEAFTSYIMSNREHFDFESSYSNDNISNKTRYGKVNLIKNIISVDKISFRNWCSENNFVINQVLEVLDDNNKLVVAKGRGKSRDKQVKFDGKAIWCYQFTKLFDDYIELVYENLKPERVEEVISPAPVVEDLQPETLFDDISDEIIPF